MNIAEHNILNLSTIRQKAAQYFIYILMAQPFVILACYLVFNLGGISEFWLALGIVLCPVLYGLQKGYVDAGNDPLFRHLTGTSYIAVVSLLVFISRGAWQIDIHMYYFAVLAMLAFFCDPFVILSAAGITAAHHLVLNFLFPYAVFPEASFLRVVLHAVIVILESSALILLTKYIQDIFSRNEDSINHIKKLIENKQQFENLRTKEAKAAKSKEEEMQQNVSSILDQLVALDLKSRIPVNDKEGFILTIATSVNNLLNALDETVVDISSVMNGAANGDLSKKVTTDCKGSFQDLKTHINSTLEKIKNIIESVSSVTQLIANQADEMGDKNIDVEKSIREQLASIKIFVKSLDAISKDLMNTSEDAKKARTLALQNQSIAQRAKAKSHECIDGFKNIAESSENISTIVSVIDGIAFQTNLLGLNASVESARVGEQGKGFSVVAKEVKELADKSSAASKEIKALITKGRQDVQLGVQLVEDSSHSFEEIASVIDNVSIVLEDIADKSSKQVDNVVNANSLIRQIEHLNVKNVINVERNKEISLDLKKKTKDLDQLISWFKK